MRGARRPFGAAIWFVLGVGATLLAILAMNAAHDQGAPRRLGALSNAFYRNCDAARADGAAPIRRGEPGYRSELDRDNDGVACEPYRGR